jgi:hypothetical protein
VSYAIMRIAKVKSAPQLGRVLTHNLRAHATTAPHADPQKRATNSVLRGATDATSVAATARARLATLPRFRKDAVLAFEVLLTASPVFFDGPKAHLRAWRDESVRWLEETFGKDNLVSVVLHEDERTPHLQAVVLPIHEGRLRAAHWTDGPAKMSALQDSYAKAVERAGLRRGERRTRVRHTTLKTFYRLADQVLQAVKERPVHAPQMPQRGPLGRVSQADWDRLRGELEELGEQAARDRARALVSGLLADSQAGARLGQRLAILREREAAAAVAASDSEAQARLRADELRALEGEAARAQQQLRAVRVAADEAMRQLRAAQAQMPQQRRRPRAAPDDERSPDRSRDRYERGG